MNSSSSSSSSGYGTAYQVLHGGAVANHLQNGGTKYYLPVMGASTATAGAENINMEVIVATAKLANWNIVLDDAPGEDRSWTFTLRKNGGDTAMTVTISGAATTGSYSGAIGVVADDEVSVSYVPSVEDPTATCVSWTMTYQPLDADKFWLSGCSNTNAANNRSGPMMGSGHTYLDRVTLTMPCAGVISNWTAHVDTAPGDAKQWIVDVWNNGLVQTPSVTIAGAATTRATDSVHTLSVAAGDRLGMKYNTSTSPASTVCRYGCNFDPTDAGTFPMGMISNNVQWSASATNYSAHAGVTYNGSTTITHRQMVTRTGTLKSLYIYLDGSSPGAGKSFTVTVYKGTDPTDLTCQMSEAQTSASVTADVEVTTGDMLSVLITPSGTPTTNYGGYGISMIEG